MGFKKVSRGRNIPLLFSQNVRKSGKYFIESWNIEFSANQADLGGPVMNIYTLWPDRGLQHRSSSVFPKPWWHLMTATTSWDSAPSWWRRGRLPRSAAGAWTRTVIWGKRRSRWRGGSAERSPARCRQQPARTSAGPDSSSRDRPTRGFWGGRRDLSGDVLRQGC